MCGAVPRSKWGAKGDGPQVLSAIGRPGTPDNWRYSTGFEGSKLDDFLRRSGSSRPPGESSFGGPDYLYGMNL